MKVFAFAVFSLLTFNQAWAQLQCHESTPGHHHRVIGAGGTGSPIVWNSVSLDSKGRVQQVLQARWDKIDEFTLKMAFLQVCVPPLNQPASCTTTIEVKTPSPVTLNLRDGKLYVGTQVVGYWYGHCSFMTEDHKSGFLFTVPVDYRSSEYSFTIRVEPSAEEMVRSNVIEKP